MDTDNSESDHESRDQERSDTGKKDHEHAESDQAPECLRVGECTAKDDKRLIGRTEKVEEEPRGEETKEDQKGKRVSEEGNGEDSGDDGEVINAEIGIVLADTKSGFGEGLRLGKTVTVNELRPRTAL